jgi:hypothetical protein
MRAKDKLTESGIGGPYRMFVTPHMATQLEGELQNGRRMFPQDPDWQQPPDIDYAGVRMTWRLTVHEVDVYAPA